MCGKFCLAFSAAFLALASPAVSQTPPESEPAPNYNAFEHASKFETAYHQRGLEGLSTLAKSDDSPVGVAFQAKHAWLNGDLKTAKLKLDDAWRRASTVEEKAAISPVLSAVWVELGLLKEAEEILRKSLQEKPQAHRVRLALGKLLVEKGSINEGEVVLNAFTGFFNNNLIKTSQELAILGTAMRLIGEYKDSNYAFERAIEKDPRNVEGLNAWAGLFMEKYKAGAAEELYKEAIAVNADSVAALVGLAETELELSRNYAKTREFLAKAIRLSPNDVAVNIIHAELAINDSDCGSAVGYADTILKNRPRNLEARTIRATCAHLDDDNTKFEKEVAEILKINPRYAKVFNRVAEFGVRVHRYEEAVALNQRALKIDPEYAKALLDIGIGQSRIGKEREAQSTLRRAFDLDTYNVRSFNMVELYDREMPDYVFNDYDRFKLRTHKNETELLNQWVPPLVAEAMTEFDRKYKFKPAEDHLSVEIFPNPQTFSVRSVGLPNISPHGICFGKVVTSRSPSEGNFNWAQVIWHEMAHVYHIQLANNRVPRWFTEGLAEYETNVKDPTWARYHDRELAAALRADNLRGVLELSKGFTHAKSIQEVLQSYHQSSLVIHFIAQTWSFDALPEMLRTWGDKKKTPEVLKLVLNTSPEEFDAKFKKWLSRYYINFQGQLTVDLAKLPTAVELSTKLAKSPNDALLWSKLAVAKYRTGDAPGAENAIQRAMQIAPLDPQVNLIAMYYKYGSGRIKDAYEHGLNILVAARDSYDIRIILGAAAAQLEDKKASELHYWAATQLWPNGVEAWESLAKIYKRDKRTAEYEQALTRLFELQQDKPNTARIYTDFFAKKRNWKNVQKGAKRWFDVNPFDTRIYGFQATAAAHLKDIESARKAWEMWEKVRPADKKKIVLSAIEVLSQTGYNSEMQEFEKRAKSLRISDSKIQRAKSPK